MAQRNQVQQHNFLRKVNNRIVFCMSGRRFAACRRACAYGHCNIYSIIKLIFAIRKLSFPKTQQPDNGPLFGSFSAGLPMFPLQPAGHH
jgi:hypothetical protein